MTGIRANIALVLLFALSASACGGAGNEQVGDGASEPGQDEVEDPAVVTGGGPALLDPEASAGSDAGLPIPAPDFQLQTLEGDRFSLADHRGEVVIVNFWATWCGPCVVEIPDLVELQEEYGSRGLTILGVSIEEDEDELVLEFARNLGVNYPIAISHALTDAFGGVYGLPTTFVIDKKGQIVHRIIGLFPVEAMLPKLEALLSESV